MRISLTPTNRLTEWLDASGNKINLNGSVVPQSAKTLKEKFIELTDYMIKNKEPRVIKAEVIKVDDKGFTYRERRSSASAADYELQVIVNYDIGPEHLWQFSIYRNGIYEDTEYGHVGEGWKEFLELLGDYFTVPTRGTKEYQSLCEWIDSSGNKITISTAGSASASPNISASKTSSQSRHKQEFIDLITYMVNHKDADVIATEESDLTGISFTYEETHKRATTGEVYTIKVCCDFINAWTCKVYKDQKLIEDTVGQTWEELLRLLNAYFNAPTSKDPLYRQLVEWIDSQGNRIDLNTSSMSSGFDNSIDQTYRFKRLLAQIDSDKSGTYKVDTLTDKILIFTIDTKYRNGIRIELACSVRGNGYLLKVNDKELKCKDYDEVLEFLTAAGIINNTDFCESLTPAAEEFLWEEFLNDYIR